MFDEHRRDRLVRTSVVERLLSDIEFFAPDGGNILLLGDTSRGKTSALKYVEQEYPGARYAMLTPACSGSKAESLKEIIAAIDGYSTQTKYLRDLEREVGRALKNRRQEHWEDSSGRMESAPVVLLLDEAQRMHPEQLQWLLDVFKNSGNVLVAASNHSRIRLSKSKHRQTDDEVNRVETRWDSTIALDALTENDIDSIVGASGLKLDNMEAFRLVASIARETTIRDALKVARFAESLAPEGKAADASHVEVAFRHRFPETDVPSPARVIPARRKSAA